MLRLHCCFHPLSEFLATCLPLSLFVIALRIYLTIPVTVAYAKRIFSKLKAIRTYMRSSIQQEHLNSLAIMADESKICTGLSLDKMLRNFANVKAQKISLS